MSTETFLSARTGLHLDEPLAFVSSEDRYSVYRSRVTGEFVHLAHGTGRRLVALFDVDLRSVWDTWMADGRSSYDFFDHLTALIVEDEDHIDEHVAFCSDCGRPGWDDEVTTTGSGLKMCDGCIDAKFSECFECEEMYRTEDMTITLADDRICDSCRVHYYTFCETCDGWRHDDSDDHDHDDDDDECDCDPMGLHFTIRNDGEDPLLNDTRVTIAQPAGTISREGIEEIGVYLCNEYRRTVPHDDDKRLVRTLSYRLDELGDQWQTKQGNYTKRLSRFAYNELHLKLSPEAVSRVGCIARDHSKSVDFAIEVTRDLNLSPEQFGHEDSCWWGSYTSSRCALKTNGGFGLRTFDDYDRVSGRAWVMPLRIEDGRMRPTFDTEGPDAFVVFNGYGNLGGYTPARILCHMVGMTYRKVSFTCPPMYVNNDAGYLVAPEEIAERYTDGSLTLHVDTHSNLFTNETKVLTYA